jgi:hypothetical protein
LTKEEIEKYLDKALKGYYLNPQFIPVAFSNVFRRNTLGEFGIMARSAVALLRYLGKKN